ncbi:uncharacterized protein B0T23DRAFT_359403 [Neurospora hispaniola]|uniref:Uncharacterized protein n=1 Tax=Neurospora hispaniola TaxID=588809 RepID=A0AAJ0I4N4_9PEZI|nr:hypothetical protein B0T23DRAFT_359403 [Neurospora hispaniola]
MANNGLQGQGLFTPGGSGEGNFKDPCVFSESDKKRQVDAELVVPAPDQISKGETISCITVFKVSKPDPEHWRADESFVFLTIDHPEEKSNWDLVTSHQQPSERRFRVRFLPDDPKNMYFLVDNIQFPAAAAHKFNLMFRVLVRPQYILSHNPHTNEIEQDPVILPDELWDGGKPDGPQRHTYVAGIFELHQWLEVKEEAGVKRQNPLSPEQEAIVARLAAIQVPPFLPEAN